MGKLRYLDRDVKKNRYNTFIVIYLLFIVNVFFSVQGL